MARSARDIFQNPSADGSANLPMGRLAHASTPAAVYLRMSTEHQQYSTENQLRLIGQYAEKHGFALVRTYSDAAKSGVLLKNRGGLRQLLQDVVSGHHNYKAVLVYDISRWGRFQDTDESAHYEFVCKSAGVPIHYCAETFSNDGTLSSLMMKALKRSMAAEYSRELGVKVFAGHKRLAELGFKQGGLPGYGLRRLLVTANRVPKQILQSGERKSIATDRVVLVPGERQEVQCVREIYRMLIFEHRTVHGIASELNRTGIPYLKDSKWDYLAVYTILTHPKYSGCHVYGRTSQKLYAPVKRLAREQWTTSSKAFEAIIDEKTFQEAQRILQNRTFGKSNEEFLQILRGLLVAHGRLSLDIISKSSAPSPSAYRRRFGSLETAYKMIGYDRPADFAATDGRRRTQAVRREL
jgi:DNA invertase Pin-like site-specific DNA recombinase